MITYPSNIKTDTEKFAVVCRWQEAMRLKRNAIARTLSTEKLHIYALRPQKQGWNIYEKLRLQILRERNRLTAKIRYANMPSTTEWKKLGRDQQHDAMIQWAGNRHILKLETTKATSPILDRFNSIDLSKLEPVEMIDPFEDFVADFTEVDENTTHTVTTNAIDVVEMRNDDNSYLYRDYTADHFGDFDHLLKITFGTRDNTAGSYFYHLGNVFGTVYTARVADDGMAVYVYGTGASRFELMDVVDDSADYYDYARGYTDPIWATISRATSTLTVIQYTDEARTSETDTISTAGASTAWRYISLACSRGSQYGTSALLTSHNIGKLDIQEGAPAGWSHKFLGVANASIGKINGIAIASIGKVNGVA